MPALVDELYSDRDYLAPTFYLQQGKYSPRLNYYATKDQAANKWLYLTNRGGSNTVPIGEINFLNNGAAQTAGINVDFYVYSPSFRSWNLLSYKEMKSYGLKSGRGIIMRFYTTDGAGPYWAILSPDLFGISATAIASVSAAKLAALDDLYRGVALMKYRYNNLVGFLNTLARKQLTAHEQQIYNQGLLLMQSLSQQMNQVNGIEITYTEKGAIGSPVLLIILIVAILAGVTGWTIYQINIEREKTQRINDAYDLNKWVTGKKQEIAAQVAAGTISQSSAKDINDTLDNAVDVANKIALNSSKNSGGFLSNVGGIIKWVVIGGVSLGAYTLLNKNKRAAQ